MDPDATWTVIADHRRLLADLLEDLDDWDRPSLCGAWRIRDVAAHVAVTPQSPSTARIVVRAIRARGDFDAVNRDLALEHAALIPDLVTELRELADSRSKPAITTLDNLLFDTMVHVQDVAVPSGTVVDVPVEAGCAAAERVWRMGWPFHARRRLRGLHLRATDGPWSAGDGADVHGPMRALLLLLTGRTQAALPDLAGPGVAALTAGPVAR